jgi:hypothetical protein
VKKALAKSQYDASDIVAKLVFFAVFIPFLSMAVGAWASRRCSSRSRPSSR